MQLLSSSDVSFQRVEGGSIDQPGPQRCLRGVIQRKVAFTKERDRLPLIQQGLARDAWLLWDCRARCLKPPQAVILG